MGEIEFRAATERDVPALAHLFTKRPPKERKRRMRARFRAEPNGWYAALLDGEVVGCCQAVLPGPRDAWLQWMRIKPSAQGAGVGGEFARYVEEQAVQRGAEVIRLNTMMSNERVHAMMGLHGYTEFARWTRLTRLGTGSAPQLLRLCERRAIRDAKEADEAFEWMRGQVGFQRSFAAVTCPSDFSKTVSLDRALVRDLAEQGKEEGGVVVTEQDGRMVGVALYAVAGGERRVLQVVAATTNGGLAAAAGAVAAARAGQSVSVQVAGTSAELTRALAANFATRGSKRHDFYVFGKRVKE